MNYRIDAEAAPGGAYDLGAFQRSLALPTSSKVAAIEARPEPTPFRAIEKVASLVLSNDKTAEAREIRREVLGEFVKRAMRAADLRMLLLEKRADAVVTKATAEGWDEARLMAAWEPIAKEAMGASGSSGAMKQYWASRFPDRKSMNMAPVEKKAELEKDAILGLGTLASGVGTLASGVGTVAKGVGKALWWGAKKPLGVGYGLAQRAFNPGMKPSKGPLGAALTGLGGYFALQSGREASRPLVHSLPGVQIA
jgi:X-X-X-Leu-X-X-Gly heptad repeat protein